MSGVTVRARWPERPMSQREAESWAEIHLSQPTPEAALCVGVLGEEILGPFRTPAEAAAALDRRLAERGPLRHGDDAGSVVFVDPARCVPQTEGGCLNG